MNLHATTRFGHVVSGVIDACKHLLPSKERLYPRHGGTVLLKTRRENCQGEKTHAMLAESGAACEK